MTDNTTKALVEAQALIASIADPCSICTGDEYKRRARQALEALAAHSQQAQSQQEPVAWPLSPAFSEFKRHFDEAASIASRHSACIDAVEENGGADSEDHTEAIHFHLYYGTFDLERAIREAAQPTVAVRDDVQNHAPGEEYWREYGKIELREWAIERWRSEVENRPLANVHRRSLDDAWRQVIRFAGGDPEQIIGPSHDALLAAAPPASQPPAQPVQERYSIDLDPYGIRALVCDAITGAVALGAQNESHPPEGHWLGEFWKIGRTADMWRASVWAIARALNCLPSTFADGNGHVLKQAEKYAATPSPVPQEWETIRRAQELFAPLIKASVDLITAVEERLELDPPLKYMVPYGAVNALIAALKLAPSPVVPPLLSEMDLTRIFLKHSGAPNYSEAVARDIESQVRQQLGVKQP